MCDQNINVTFFMYTYSVGALKRYDLNLNSTIRAFQKYTRCIYLIDDPVYEQIVTNGFIDDPAFYTDTDVTKAMESKMMIKVEARNTFQAEIKITFKQQMEIT